MEDERRRLEDDPLLSEFDGRGYRLEPEYTDEELRRMEAEEGPGAPGAAPRWCACGMCRQMPTEEERRCCTQWDLVVGAAVRPPGCVTVNEVRQLIQKPVLETFFRSALINRKTRPTPEGPDGQLSDG